MKDRKGGMKTIWTRLENLDIEDFPTASPFCQAPRHDHTLVKAEFMLVIANTPEGDLFQTMCRDCLSIITNDLGRDIDRDALPARAS